MSKKGQLLTAFFILLLVLIGTFGFIYFLKNLDSENPEISTYQSAEFESKSEAVKEYVQSCLETTTGEAIDIFGLLDGNEEMFSTYIENNIGDCIDFEIFSKTGMTVRAQDPIVVATITEQSVLVDMQYPINIEKNGANSKLEHFNYFINREQSRQMSFDANGRTTRSQVVVASDNDVEIEIPQGTRITDQLGNTITDPLSVKIIDRSFDGLSNDVVIGTVVYEGKPDGAIFDPPINLQIESDYEDKPLGFPYQDLKCAYYDQESGVWRTYPTVSVTKNDQTQTYKLECLVDHFTMIAVVTCGQYNDEPVTIDLKEVFKHPIEPVESKYWMDNKVDGMHLIPEAMDGENCDLTRGNADTVAHLMNGQLVSVCDDLLRDWDEDDDDDSDNTINNVKFYHNGVEITNLDNAEKQKCIKACQKKAEDRYEDWEMSGDGINDNLAELRCKVKKEMDGAKYYNCLQSCLWSGRGANCEEDCEDEAEEYIVEVNAESCIVGSSSHNGPFDNIVDKCDGNGEKTMECPRNNMAFYATPKTYGYEIIEGNPIASAVSDEDITLGGYAEIVLELKENGDSCADSSRWVTTNDMNPTNSAVTGNLVDQGAGNTQQADGPTNTNEICSDSCALKINDVPVETPEEIMNALNQGTNRIKVYLNNLVNVEMFAGKEMEFGGVGIKFFDECEPTVQKRINEIYAKKEKLGAVWDPDSAHGRELNCLALYRDYMREEGTNVMDTSLCEIEVGYDSFSSVSFRQWAAERGADYCEHITYDPEEYETGSGTVLASTTGGMFQGTEYCGTVLTTANEGCICGGEKYQPKADGTNSYCCRNQIYAHYDRLKASLEDMGIQSDYLSHCKGQINKRCWCNEEDTVCSVAVEPVPGAKRADMSLCNNPSTKGEVILTCDGDTLITRWEGPAPVSPINTECEYGCAEEGDIARCVTAEEADEVDLKGCCILAVPGGYRCNDNMGEEVCETKDYHVGWISKSCDQDIRCNDQNTEMWGCCVENKPNDPCSYISCKDCSGVCHEGATCSNFAACDYEQPDVGQNECDQVTTCLDYNSFQDVETACSEDPCGIGECKHITTTEGKLCISRNQQSQDICVEGPIAERYGEKGDYYFAGNTCHECVGVSAANPDGWRETANSRCYCGNTRPGKTVRTSRGKCVECKEHQKNGDSQWKIVDKSFCEGCSVLDENLPEDLGDDGWVDSGQGVFHDGQCYFCQDNSFRTDFPEGCPDHYCQQKYTYGGQNLCYECKDGTLTPNYDEPSHCLCEGEYAPGYIYFGPFEGETECLLCVMTEEGAEPEKYEGGCNRVCHVDNNDRLTKEILRSSTLGNGEHFWDGETCWYCSNTEWKDDFTKCDQSNCIENAEKIEVGEYYCYTEGQFYKYMKCEEGGEWGEPKDCDSGCEEDQIYSSRPSCTT